MIDARIEDGDLLVIDKALEAKDGDIAVCLCESKPHCERPVNG